MNIQNLQYEVLILNQVKYWPVLSHDELHDFNGDTSYLLIFQKVFFDVQYYQLIRPKFLIELY